ncbi:hypothetical protein [Psychrobacter pygoscelis]|uniref:hypothetical protein n=1 Tax=Psychrobacter pygoscelis TaxID=2488563 RepID=UPI00103A9B54|nr:hypothetical protein [Psychrobacter pygoscelis]
MKYEPKNNAEIIFYSFATKYCNLHNKNAYPICDSFVEKTLIARRNKDGFSLFKNKGVKKFAKFRHIIHDFSKYYKLTESSIKEIDKFL